MRIILLLFVSFSVHARELIVYTSSIINPPGQAPNTDIYFMDLATKKSQRLTSFKGLDHSPTLHPAGDLVAYITDEWAGQHGEDQLAMRSLTSNLSVRLDVGQHMIVRTPKFSADGKYLYFSMAPVPSEDTWDATYRIYRYELLSKELTDVSPLETGNFFDVSPSPDGTRLAYRRASGDGQHVRVMELQTRESKVLNPERPENLPEERPAWRGDQEVTVVTSYGEHEPLQRSLFTVPLSSRPAQQILQSPLIYDHHGACWFNQDRGVISGMEVESGSLQLFLVEKDELIKISSMDFWWSGEVDCRSL